jgi:Protein of unknown function (DUF2764).
MNYYFLLISLPKIQLGQPPEIGVNELKWLLHQNLRPKDLALVEALFRLFDLENLRQLWLGRPLNPLGNWDRFQLETALLQRELFPQYVRDFLNIYGTTEERLVAFPKLLKEYYRIESKTSSHFLSWYLSFLDQCRIVMAFLRGRATGRSIMEEMAGEKSAGLQETLGEALQRQVNLRDIDIPLELTPLVALFERYQKMPLELDQAFDRYLFDQIEEFVEMQFFSIDALLAYLAEYAIAYKEARRDPVTAGKIAKDFFHE